MDYHKPVMLAEALEHLKINKGKKYIDATLGDAGHAIEIMKRGGIVLGLEINDEALLRAQNRIAAEGLTNQFFGALGNFKKIDALAKQQGFTQVDGILFDLGYSSFELDESGVGLTFMREEPLDMRLDRTLGVTAADLVNSLPEKALETMIREYSDETMARRFAKAIIRARSLKKLQTTTELAKVLSDETSPGYEHGRINPATRTFQALRIAVNDELVNLETSLPRAARLLVPGGRLVVISFHSLEDSLAKQFGHDAQPSITMVTKKPLLPSETEVKENSRARSARMRIFEKDK